MKKTFLTLSLLLNIFPIIAHDPTPQYDSNKIVNMSSACVSTMMILLSPIYNHFHGMDKIEQTLLSQSTAVHCQSTFANKLRHFLDISNEEISKIHCVPAINQIFLGVSLKLPFVVHNRMYNAYTSKNYIFIPEQMIADIINKYNESPELSAEYIAVIAHEIEHLRARDIANLSKQKTFVATGSIIALLSAISYLMRTDSYYLSSEPKDTTLSLVQNIIKEAKKSLAPALKMFACQLCIVIPFARFCAYKHQQIEYTADSLTCVKSKYKKLIMQGLTTFLSKERSSINEQFQQLPTVPAAIKKSLYAATLKLSNFFSTHPTPEKRIAILEKRLAKL